MSARALVRLNLAISLLLVVPLGASSVTSGSQLAFAQAADALTDAFVTVALLLAIRVASTPPDDRHPFGHHGAEPLAALLAAAAAAVLSVEVMKSAWSALDGEAATVGPELGALFGLRMALRGAVVALAARARRAGRTPALDALFVDARNDVAVAAVAVAGWAVATQGWPRVDAWLALPLGLWIGLSGLLLARENVALLMGEAPSPERRGSFERLAAAASGGVVLGVRARSEGSLAFVDVEIGLPPETPLAEAHRVATGVREALERDPTVAEAIVRPRPWMAAPQNGG